MTGAKLLSAKGLDIETLKLEVERRGGYDEVEKRREWRQIARAMNVPPNTCAEHLRCLCVAATVVGARPLLPAATPPRCNS